MCPAEDPTSESMPAVAPTILVVEDEVLIRLSIAEHLRGHGFTVIEASTAEEARSVMMADIQIDAVFTDVETPKGDGIGLAEWIVANDPALPVVITSGVAGARDEAQLRLPAVPFVNKPYAGDVVETRLREALKQAKQKP